MKSFITVFKLLLMNMLRIDKTKRNKRTERVALILIIGFSYLFIMVSIVIGVAFITGLLVENGLLNSMLTALFGVATFIVFILGIVSLFTTLFFSKDSEFFLSLPVKPSAIFLAKFALVYITELIIAAAILLPLVLTVGVVAEMSAVFYAVMLLGVLLAPAFSLLLASIIALPLMFVVSFFKNKGALTSLVVILLFALGFGVYMFFVLNMQNNAIEGDGSSFEGILNVLSFVGYPFAALVNAATLTPLAGLDVAVSVLINLGIFLLTVAALVGLALIIANFIYRKGASSQLEGRKRKSTGKERFVEGTAVKALIKKEWRDLIRTPAFAYQCLSTVVLTPIMVAFLTVGSFADMYSAISDVEGVPIETINAFASAIKWFFGFGMLVMFGIGMNIAASTAITREGQAFYYSKMLPVDYKTQIKAKQILCMIISATGSGLGLIVLTITSGNLILLPFGAVFIALYAFGFNNFAIYNDLKKPKLDWATPNEAVKQNFRIMMPYFVNMAMSVVMMIFPIVILIALWFINSIAAQLIIWVVFYIFAAVVALIFHRLLGRNIDRLYEDLTV